MTRTPDPPPTEALGTHPPTLPPTMDPGGPSDPTTTHPRVLSAPGPYPGAAPLQVSYPGDVAPHIRAFLERARSPATRRAREHHWASWRGWCLVRGERALPAEPRAIVEWLHAASRPRKDGGWGLSKVEGTLNAIAHAHRLAGYDPPPTAHTFVRQGLEAFRRIRGVRPEGRKAPITMDELGTLLAQLDRATLAGKRDAALLLVAWWTAMRRSEVVAIEVRDVAPAPAGRSILIRRSKTDQAGEGEVVGLDAKGGPLCPVAAFDAWLAASGIREGPVFRGLTRHGGVRRRALREQEVARLVKRLAAGIGLDPARFGGHSLRAGFVTEAVRQNVSDLQIMATTRHKSVTMLDVYRREADPVQRGASSRIKLPEK